MRLPGRLHVGTRCPILSLRNIALSSTPTTATTPSPSSLTRLGRTGGIAGFRWLAYGMFRSMRSSIVVLRRGHRHSGGFRMLLQFASGLDDDWIVDGKFVEFVLIFQFHEIRDVEEGIALQAYVHKSGLHAWQHAGYTAFIDRAG